jgi:hypothetical protein
MNNETFLKIQNDFDNDIIITPDNVMNKILMIPKLYSKYLNLYIREKRLLKIINTDVDKLFKKIYHDYKFNKNFVTGTIKEIEKYVSGDDDYIKIKLKFDKQSVYVEYLEKMLQVLNGLGYQINNYVDLLKIKNGII